MTTQALLVGHLSQYFCEKNSLEEELEMLKDSDKFELIQSKQEEIDTATRNAYLYAAGMLSASLTVAILHAWIFYLSHKIGMMCRIILTGAIYTKVFQVYQNFFNQFCFIDLET